MKKLIILSITLIFFSGITIASSYQPTKTTPDNKAKTASKKPAKKDVKKVPHRTTSAKKTATNTKSITK